MSTPISKELTAEIYRKAFEYSQKQELDEGEETKIAHHNWVMGAASYAHYKERWEQAKKVLEEIADMPLDRNCSFAIAKATKALASWKEEGKDTQSLRDLKDITDEDALEVYPILSSYPMTDENKIKNVKNLFRDFHSAQTNIPGRSWYKAFKYLESKGYAI